MMRNLKVLDVGQWFGSIPIFYYGPMKKYIKHVRKFYYKDNMDWFEKIALTKENLGGCVISGQWAKFMWLNDSRQSSKDCRINIHLPHECLHLSCEILREHNVNYHAHMGGEETLAYLQGHFIKQCRKLIK